jgi:xylan 1,4-beta-xylosidase
MVHLHLQNFKLLQRASVLRVDDQHSNALTAYVAMGSPRYPSQAQIKTMRDAGKLSPPEVHTIHNNTLDITIPPNGLDVITLR